MGSLHATRPLSPPPSGIHNPASGVYSPNSVLCMARGALLAQHRAGTSTQAQAWVLRPGATRRGPESVSPSQGTWATVQGPSVSWALWASCLLILRSLVLGPAPQKSCAVHSAESSETCGWPRLRNDPIAGPWYQLQAFSLPSRQGLKGRMHRDLGCVKCVPAQSLGLGTKRGRGRRGTAQSVVLQGP